MMLDVRTDSQGVKLRPSLLSGQALAPLISKTILSCRVHSWHELAKSGIRHLRLLHIRPIYYTLVVLRLDSLLE